MRPHDLVEHLPLSLVKVPKAAQFEGTLNIPMLKPEPELYVLDGQGSLSSPKEGSYCLKLC